METKRIAVVGMGAILPDAFDVESFWNNLQTRKYSIIDVPADRWNTSYYYDPDPKAEDKTYSKIGAFVRGYQFDAFESRVGNSSTGDGINGSGTTMGDRRL